MDCIIFGNGISILYETAERKQNIDSWLLIFSYIKNLNAYKN